MSEPQRRGIQSVEIAAAILEALESVGGAASLSRIAAEAGMQASKVHRYLVSLTRVGMVDQSPVSGLYDLGPAARRLGAEAIRRTDEANVAGPHLAALRDECGHSVNLTAWGDAGPVLTRWEIGHFPMSVTVRVGGSLPLWSSVGRVFLAHLPPSVTHPIFEAQRGIGVPEDADLDALADELQQIRDERLSYVSNTPVIGIDGFASPVFDAFGNVPLVVGVVTPRPALDDAGRDRIAALLRSTTASVSAELGYLPGDHPDEGAASA
jgi:DNA-binding IclR family transcriptional regulator